MRYLYAKANAPSNFISCEKIESEFSDDKKEKVEQCYALLYVKRGTLVITSSDRIFDVQKDRFALILKGEKHITSVPEKCEYYKLCFDVEHPSHINNSEFLNILKTINQEDEKESRAQSVFLIPENGYNIHDNKIAVRFSKLREIQKIKNKWSPYMMHYSLSLFLSEMTRAYLSIYKADKEPALQAVSLVTGLIKHWVEQNYQKNPNIKEIAEIFGYNSRYLTTLFRESTGFTLIEYIHKVKLDKSKQLLCSSSLSIKDIAYSAGFDSDKYFMKLFKKFEEMTPSEYRKLFSKQ